MRREICADGEGGVSLAVEKEGERRVGDVGGRARNRLVLIHLAYLLPFTPCGSPRRLPWTHSGHSACAVHTSAYCDPRAGDTRAGDVEPPIRKAIVCVRSAGRWKGAVTVFVLGDGPNFHVPSPSPCAGSGEGLLRR
jgi:hypothetical protein